MPNLLRITAVLLLISVACHAQSSDDKKAIRQCYDMYNSALADRDFNKAWSYLDSRTSTYYAAMADRAKNSDSTAIDSLLFTDKLLILLMRHTMTLEELLALNGASVFAFSSKQNTKATISSIGKISIEKNFARCEWMIEGKKAPVDLHFYKENGRWRLNLESLRDAGNARIAKDMETSGRSENETIMMILQMSTGQEPAPGIWHPVQ